MRRSRPYRFRHPKGRCIQVEFDFMPGKRISTGTDDPAEAVLFAEDYLDSEGREMDRRGVPTLSEFARGIFLRSGRGSIRDMDRLYKRNYSEKHYREKQARVDRYILPEFGSYLVTAILTRSIEAWLPYVVSADTGRPLADDTKNKLLVAFRDVMEEVRRSGYRDDNPARDVRLIRAEGEARKPLPKHVMALLFPPDIDERVRVWGSEMWALYFSVFYDTGMRPGEIAALRVCDVYRTPRGLAVGTLREVSNVERRIVERVKTTDKGMRKRPGLLYDDTAALLVRYVVGKGLRGEDLLFTAPRCREGLIFDDTSNKHLKDTLRRLGVYEEGMVQYCLRHNYETDRRGDMPDSLLALSMGHTRLRDDYDHQQTVDMIRRLDDERDSFFANRSRDGRNDAIVPLSELMEREGIGT